MGKHLLPIALLTFIYQVAIAEDGTTAADLILMEFEDLVNMDVEIRSAGKSSTRAMDLPYAAHILTSKEIMSSGAQSIPEALRLIPGLGVGQISANEWSVAVRGSGGRFSRYVLVMVDGRIAYNTLFSGVNWDELNYLMESIDRIEVVRGPNAAAWGANAVNGIIHIITKKGNEDSYLSLWGGNKGRKGTGGNIHFDIGNNWDLGIQAHAREWQGLQDDAGLGEADSKDWRISTSLKKTSETHQSHIAFDVHGSDHSPRYSWIVPNPPYLLEANIGDEKQGWSLLAEYSGSLNSFTNFHLKGAVDDFDRTSIVYNWHSSNYQFDAEVSVEIADHRITTGINTRLNDSELSEAFNFKLKHEKREIDNYGIFLIDTIKLSEQFRATLSLRLDDHELSGVELQPSLRLLWQPSETQSFWLASSEASATPARGTVDITDSYYHYVPAQIPNQPLPYFVKIVGFKDDKTTTRIHANEAGWRKTFDKFNLDIVAFNQRYKNDSTATPTSEPIIIFDESFLPIRIEQEVLFTLAYDYSARGLELTTRAQLRNNWQAQFSYSRLHLKDDIGPWQSSFSFKNVIDFSEKLQFGLTIRHSHGDSSTTAQLRELNEEFSKIDNYYAADVNLSWLFSEKLKVTFSAINLGKKHVEALREQLTTSANFVEPYALLKTSYSF